jgi:uncharacterized protein
VSEGVEPRPSPRAGTGLFALRPFRAGERIVEYTGEKITKEESASRRKAHNNYVFHLNYRHDIDGAGLDNIARYINHSCDPNCRVQKSEGRIFVEAARDIAPDEELSFDYGYDLSEYARFPCTCGARVCCGYIVGREFWGELPQTWGEA